MKDNHHPMEKLNKMHEDVVNAAYEIIEKKKATYYGIGLGLAKLVKTILNNEHEILTVSTYLDDNYGHSGLYTHRKPKRHIPVSIMQNDRE